MSTGMLSVGITGIQAAQLGLQVTQHNIANANTDGYNRQYILQSAGVPRLTGAGYFGSGTAVDSVHRNYDQYLVRNTFEAQSQVSQSDAQLAKLNQLSNLFGDVDAGLATALQGFFTGAQQVAANPSLVTARQTMVSTSQVLVAGFQNISGRMTELYDATNGEIQGEVSLINTYAKQIAALNDQIVRAEASTRQTPNDLLDQRDQLVSELNKHVRVYPVNDSNGSFSLFLGKGVQLVVGSAINEIRAIGALGDPERIEVALVDKAGNSMALNQSVIEGGKLGGIMAFRENTLDVAANKLGAVAASIALTFNAQHALGQDLWGANATSSASAGFQADYFSITSPRVVPQNGSPTPGFTAEFISPPAVDANGAYYAKLTGSDYQLTQSGANYVMTRVSDGKTFTGTDLATLNTAISSEGFQLAGTLPSAGQNYQIQPTRRIADSFQMNQAIVADPKRIAAGVPVTSSLGLGNTGALRVSQGSVSEGYALAGLPLEITYSVTTGQFSTSPSTSVSVTYADGTTASGNSFARMNGGAEVASLTVAGITVTLAGSPAHGDKFTIGLNANGQDDGRNIIKLGALQTQSAMEGGNATFQSSYASMVSEIGIETRRVKVTGQAQQSLLDQNKAAIADVSGVNLDEEAANLIKYQQAYQASARAFDIASKLFDVLLSIAN